VIVGAVTGAVLGTRKHNSADVDNIAGISANSSTTPTATGTAATTSPTATSTPAVNTTLIKKRTALSVSGERTGDDFSIRLYYQGDDSVIWVSTFDSKSGKWSGPANVIKAPSYTSLAASSFLHSEQYVGNQNSDFNVRTSFSLFDART